MKFILGQKVKYNGEYYSPNTPFEVDKKDVEHLRQLGAHEIKADSKSEVIHENAKAKVEVNTEETEDDKLKAKAESLGIRVGNKGTKRLQEEIEALEG